jgi:hypothetical protein
MEEAAAAEEEEEEDDEEEGEHAMETDAAEQEGEEEEEEAAAMEEGAGKESADTANSGPATVDPLLAAATAAAGVPAPSVAASESGGGTGYAIGTQVEVMDENGGEAVRGRAACVEPRASQLTKSLSPHTPFPSQTARLPSSPSWTRTFPVRAATRSSWRPPSCPRRRRRVSSKQAGR